MAHWDVIKTELVNWEDGAKKNAVCSTKMKTKKEILRDTEDGLKRFRMYLNKVQGNNRKRNETMSKRKWLRLFNKKKRKKPKAVQYSKHKLETATINSHKKDKEKTFNAKNKNKGQLD